jgi:hypothetical protein
LHGQFSAADEPVIFASPICTAANEQKHPRNQALVVSLLFDCGYLRLRIRTGAGAESLSNAQGAKGNRRQSPW